MNPAYHEVYKTLGLNIMYYRNRADLSQRQLGDLLDKDQSHVSRIERAGVGVSLDLLCRIAEILEVEPYLLLKPKD
ncbi:XRE family transcriptional regulator [Colidextribacter sp. OB.20]|uniref:helix-turn-helix domain-containing protein n=1 Tax=Colidextribacter sp. OB.20 TaxID=2304568 RepID=UPI00137123C3|nr:helix-turn-helix transcriptional regulator [Colidextribacter sp. OB.20]NBI09001.1 XRE family transcriptional regulator [Colidextribacter sp. OB.20]